MYVRYKFKEVTQTGVNLIQQKKIVRFIFNFLVRVKLWVAIFLLIIISSCNDSNFSVSNDIYDFREFTTVDSITLTNFVEYTPASFYFIDSVLIIFNIGLGDSFFYTYNFNSNSFSEGFLPKGRGPNESIGAWWAGIYKKQLWVFDLTMRKILIYDLKDIVSEEPKIPLEMISFTNQYYRMDFISDSIIWIVGDENTDTKISEVDLYSEEIIRELGVFPDIQNDIPLSAFKDAFTSYIYVRPPGDKAVLPYRYTDVIEIFDISNGDSKAIMGPYSFNPVFEVGRNPDHFYMSKTKESRKAFISGVVTEKYIYLLFSGHYRNEEYWNRGRYIFIYDWNGNPIRNLVLDRYINMFGITDNDSVLYSYDNKTGYIVKAYLFQ